MKKTIFKITITILIILIMISCLLLFIIYEDRHGSSNFTRATWLSETDPSNRYTITAVKSTNNSPLALYADYGVDITIKDCETNKVIQSFSTSLQRADEESYSIKYDDQGISLVFLDDKDRTERTFYFSYDSLSKLGTNVRGDK